MADELKAWTCQKNRSHVLGQVRRNGSGVQQLLLYRVAVDLTELSAGDEMAEVDVMAVIEGFVGDVRCSICGAARTWFPGPEAVRKLMERGDV